MDLAHSLPIPLYARGERIVTTRDVMSNPRSLGEMTTLLLCQKRDEVESIYICLLTLYYFEDNGILPTDVTRQIADFVKHVNPIPQIPCRFNLT